MNPYLQHSYTCTMLKTDETMSTFGFISFKSAARWLRLMREHPLYLGARIVRFSPNTDTKYIHFDTWEY